jgi:hypothetical protein
MRRKKSEMPYSPHRSFQSKRRRKKKERHSKQKKKKKRKEKRKLLLMNFTHYIYYVRNNG